ncbi:hypothetical protein Tco_0139268 [Tanacetum coccineum]
MVVTMERWCSGDGGAWRVEGGGGGDVVVMVVFGGGGSRSGDGDEGGEGDVGGGLYRWLSKCAVVTNVCRLGTILVVAMAGQPLDWEGGGMLNIVEREDGNV